MTRVETEPSIVGNNVEQFTDLSLVPPDLRPRDWGNPSVPIPLGDIIRASQVRYGINPRFGEIKESIKTKKLINNINIALLDRELMTSYLDFLNRLWGSGHNIDDYVCSEDGFYYLVAAGHTRTESIVEIALEEAEEAREQGFIVNPMAHRIYASLHIVTQPEEILAIQLAENTYQEPSEERQAIAIVEAFRYGIELGKWKNKEQFISRAGKNFTRTQVDRAMLFVELPAEAQEQVIMGRHRYSFACEVARLIRPYRQFIVRETLGDDPERAKVNQTEIEATITKHVLTELERARKNKTTIKKLRTRISDYIRGYKQVSESSDEQESEALRLFEAAQDEAFYREKRRIGREYSKAIYELGRSQTTLRAKVLNISRVVLGPDSTEHAKLVQLIGESDDIWSQTIRNT